VRTLSLIALICFLACSFAGGQDKAQPQPSQTDQPVQVGPGIHAPVPTNTPEAAMPGTARDKHQGGMCVVSVVVDAKGMPQNPHVLRCTDSMFEKNSMNAVKQYRFKPAFRTSDGTAVPVTVAIEINFRFDAFGPTDDAPAKIRYGFFSPPGVTSGDADASGTYPFSKRLEGPKMTQFVSNGFGQAAAVFPDGTSCKVLLVLDAKGKPLTASISQCDKPTLEQPAIDSLMKSQYEPAKLNGKEVSVRLLVYLLYEGFGPHPKITRPGTQH
jgi:TonB family protein